jgi:outer membrane protein, multidrug efflux system
LGKSKSVVYSPGASLRWMPIDFGAIRSRVKASEARAQRSLASYEQTVATALEETEGPFNSYTLNAQSAERLLTATTIAQEAAQLARLRFDSGETDFLIALDVEREGLSNRDQLAQAQIDSATALLSVYSALGVGGWVAQLRRLRRDPLPDNCGRHAVRCGDCSPFCSRPNIRPSFSGSV